MKQSAKTYPPGKYQCPACYSAFDDYAAYNQHRITTHGRDGNGMLMKITTAQYPGLTQNLVTLGQVDLSDNDPAMLAQLALLLNAALENVARALATIGAEEEEPTT